MTQSPRAGPTDSSPDPRAGAPRPPQVRLLLLRPCVPCWTVCLPSPTPSWVQDPAISPHSGKSGRPHRARQASLTCDPRYCHCPADTATSRRKQPPRSAVCQAATRGWTAGNAGLQPRSAPRAEAATSETKDALNGAGDGSQAATASALDSRAIGTVWQETRSKAASRAPVSPGTAAAPHVRPKHL